MLNTLTALEKSTSPYPIHPFNILENESIASFFEPLISVQKMGVIGLEVSGRAVDPEGGNLIDPRHLFRSIPKEDSGTKIALDHLFRQKGLEDFSALQARKPGLLLFLGVHPSLLEEDLMGPDFLLRQVEKCQLDPRQVVVQISLSEKMNELRARKFMEYQRLSGFLTALKDVTTEPHHLDALYRFNPDIIQAAPGVVKGIADNFERQRAFRRMVKAAHIPGVLVACGVIQSEEDGLVALDIGADLLRGKYLSKSYKNHLVFTLNRKQRIGFLSSRYRRRVINRAKRDGGLMDRAGRILPFIFSRLENSLALWPEQEFPKVFRDYPALECIYLLDAEGVQVSETICSSCHIPERKKLLFKPSSKGSDHSLQEYYYALSGTPYRHLTGPHLSMNSGNLCVTSSKIIGKDSGDLHILCVDLNLSKI